MMAHTAITRRADVTLDAFLKSMKADAEIEDAAADRLDALLRGGKNPKADEIETALFQSPEDEAEGAGGDGCESRRQTGPRNRSDGLTVAE